MGRMIENVIAQAHLEEGRARGGHRSTRPWLGRSSIREALQRAVRAGFDVRRVGRSWATRPVRVDPGARRAAFSANLVENACKYGAGPPVTVSFRRRSDGKVAHAPCATAAPPLDAGQGASRIFRVYDRGGRDETDSKRGLGLGLPLSRQLARSMGGELLYEDGSFVLLVPKG